MGEATINGRSYPETSNYLPCTVVIDGITYSSAENYFQCAKTTNKADFDMVFESGPGLSAYLAGQKVQLRSDWELIKINEMYKGNLAKFQQNEDLQSELLSTGVHPIIFIRSSAFWNTWHRLVLERIRAELRQDGEEDARRAAEIQDAMDKFAQRNRSGVYS